MGPYLDAVRPYFDVSSAVENPRALLDDAGIGSLGGTLATATSYLGVVGTGLLHLFVMFAVAFYLLRDDHRLVAWARSLDVEWGVLETYVAEVDASLETVFAGNLLNAVITGTVGALTYSLLNVVAPGAVAIPYPALIGLLAGVGSLIPVVGMKIVYVPVAAYLATLAWMAGAGWGFVALFVAVSFLVVDVIPDLIVRPYVSGGSLHTGLLMFAYVLGPLLFGWYGLFLGPVLLVLVTHFAGIVGPELVGDRGSSAGERRVVFSPPVTNRRGKRGEDGTGRGHSTGEDESAGTSTGGDTGA